MAHIKNDQLFFRNDLPVQPVCTVFLQFRMKDTELIQQYLTVEFMVLLRVIYDLM